MVHEFRYALRAGQGKHVHGNIDGSLEQDYRERMTSGKPHTAVNKVRQHKQAAPLQESAKSDKQYFGFMGKEKPESILVIGSQPPEGCFSFFRRFAQTKPDGGFFHGKEQFFHPWNMTSSSRTTSRMFKNNPKPYREI